MRTTIFLLLAMPCVVLGQTFVVRPTEYEGALRNPLKGFRPLTEDALSQDKLFATITHSYFKWNELEDDESDTVERIKDLCDVRWAGVAKKGIKVIPSIYLDFNEDEKYWPADMTDGDYSSDQFKRRLTRLISRLGECWNDDPRVAWVETSIIGLWGEQHSPSPTPEIQKLMGDAFTKAFPDKQFLVRHPDEFTDYEVGYTWGSWAHGAQIDDDAHGGGIERVNRETGRWKTHPMEGEIAYNWGTVEETLGGAPDVTLREDRYREILVDSIYNLHCTGLGWVAKYTQDDPVVRAAADEVQRAFGYRYVVPRFRCVKRVEPGEELAIQFSVINRGAAPFYSDWPVEVSLLDEASREVVWTETLDDVDIRRWLSGDEWDAVRNKYREAAKVNVVDAAVRVPSDLPRGEYVVALAILDPAGMQPAVRFAMKNYFKGGRHPMGRVGVGVDVRDGHELDAAMFVDPMAEVRIGYEDPTPLKRSGFVTIASRFDDEPEPDNKWIIGTKETSLQAVSNGSWVLYKDFDFGEATNHFRVRAGSASDGGMISLRLGSQTGREIGSVRVTNTGGWGDCQNFETTLRRPVRGVHDLYLMFVDPSDADGYLFDIESFKFSER